MKWRKKVSRYILEIFIILLSVIIVAPLLIMVFGSFKDSTEAAKAALTLPVEWKFDNYLFVIKEGGMGRAFINSVLITFFSVFFTVILSSSCGYILSRRKTRTSRGIYYYIFIGMVAPYQIVTTFILFRILGISGYASVITLYVAINLPFSVILYEGFVKSIPSDIDESAVIDGCGPFRAFTQIIFPLLKPVTVTNIITVAMAVWNEFVIPLFLLSSARHWTLPLTVYNFFGQYSSNWNYVYANLVLTALPIVILYLFLQKYIIAGMTAGAVKS